VTRAAGDRVGIGLLYQPQLRRFFLDHADAFDYAEVVPDTLWIDRAPDGDPRYVDDGDTLDWLHALGKPVVLHSIGLSIGSVHRFDIGHVHQIAAWQKRLAAPWHSDHLAWHLAEAVPKDVNVNLTLPVTLDASMLALITDRVRRVQEQVEAPFLLENNVYYFDCGDVSLDEAEFLSEIVRRTGCGVLLDLHNLYVNVRNRNVDPAAYLAALDLEAVVELHVAGGFEYEGFYLDAHSGAVPEPVWQLVEEAVPGCPQLRGVTFELFGSWYERLGEARLRGELGRLAEAVRRPHDAVGAGR
jgi:uncharacterized protein (UPF0276 family)